MLFVDRLIAAIREKQTPLVVGLDPHFELLPTTLRQRAGATLDTAAGRTQAAEICGEFCCEVVRIVSPLIAAVKPQLAFFEQWGPAGMSALRKVVDVAQQHGLLVILDGKRNDIGSTATAYANAMLGRGNLSAFGGDALTVSPWLGGDSLSPFVERCRATGCGLFVLVKTSNPGSRDYQELETQRGALYQIAAADVERLARQLMGTNGYGSVGAVVGATFPDQLRSLRQAMPHTMFLVPGYGAQGAAAADLSGGFDEAGLGAIVNSSRGILFAFRENNASSTDWQQCVADATRAAIADLADHTPAGRLRRPT